MYDERKTPFLCTSNNKLPFCWKQLLLWCYSQFIGFREGRSSKKTPKEDDLKVCCNILNFRFISQDCNISKLHNILKTSFGTLLFQILFLDPEQNIWKGILFTKLETLNRKHQFEYTQYTKKYKNFGEWYYYLSSKKVEKLVST